MAFEHSRTLSHIYSKDKHFKRPTVSLFYWNKGTRPWETIVQRNWPSGSSENSLEMFSLSQAKGSCNLDKRDRNEKKGKTNNAPGAFKMWP